MNSYLKFSARLSNLDANNCIDFFNVYWHENSFKNDYESIAIDNKGFMKGYLKTFALTKTNPLTILLFITEFAGLGLSNAVKDKLGSIPLVLGVFNSDHPFKDVRDELTNTIYTWIVNIE